MDENPPLDGGFSSISSFESDHILASRAYQYPQYWVVNQIDQLPGQIETLCTEFSPPIPDEFQASTITSFWLQMPGTGAVAFNSTHKGIHIMNGSYSVPSLASSLVNLVSVPADFDVYAMISCDDGASGKVRRALLVARTALSGGSTLAGIGVKCDENY